MRPCYDCKKRFIGCKANCQEEAEWQAKQKTKRALIYKNRNLESDYFRYRKEKRKR